MNKNIIITTTKVGLVGGMLAAALTGCCLLGSKNDGCKKCCCGDGNCGKTSCCCKGGDRQAKPCGGRKTSGVNTSMTLGIGTDGISVGTDANVGSHGASASANVGGGSNGMSAGVGGGIN